MKCVKSAHILTSVNPEGSSSFPGPNRTFDMGILPDVTEARNQKDNKYGF